MLKKLHLSLRVNYQTSVAFHAQHWVSACLRSLQTWGRQWVGRGVWALLLLCCLTWGTMEVAWAADSPEEPIPAAEAPLNLDLDASTIPSEKVQAFVTAYVQVVALIDQREGELQRAETESESFQIQQEIQAEAFDLIETAGLTQQEYWQLLGLANSDPDFRDRILAQLEETTP